ncbi:MAG: ATP-binding protein [Actinomycetota bacterium]
MSSRLTLRARLTVVVTATFAVVVVLGAATAMARVESSLVADTRASAERVLGEYLESINGGTAAVGVVDEQVGTRFFYRDETGASIGEREYYELLTNRIEAELPAAFGADFFDLPTFDPTAQPPAVTNEISAAPMFVAQSGTIEVLDNGELIAADGTALSFAIGPLPSGSPTPVELGADVVAVAQTLAFADGSTVQVGVSSPLQPVTDSIDAFGRVVWIAVPLLIAAVAGVTWLAASRTLQPVHGISARARAITADRLGERVPVPGTHDEIRELAETVNGMLDRIEASQQRQRRLVSDASHELRSPVAASRAQLEVALAANDVGDWRRTALTVLDEQEQLSTLIDDLLTLSRLDEGEFRTAQLVDVADLVDVEVARARPLRPQVRQRPGADACVVGDVRLLERLLRNLVDNAVRHAEAAVEISLQRTTDAVVVHVDDDGPGVAEVHRRAVFERFTRLDEARDRDRGGSGLGLSIVHEVAEVHGGAVACVEAPLGGARFTVVLPAPA